MSFRDLALDIDYTGRGEDILAEFVLPVLSKAREYDRVTSFFTTESLVAIAAGLDELWARQGRMRLVLGLHDVPEDLAEAARESDDPVAEVIAQVRSRIVSGIARISDELTEDRLATIAWMMQDGLLEVSVAAPHSLSGRSPGIFHNKVFIFRDSDGDTVAAVGSSNETGAGLGSNFEHLTAFASWEQPRYTEAQAHFFERLWQNRQEGLSVRLLDTRFADEILQALHRPSRVRPPDTAGETLQMRTYLDAAAKMPALAMVAGGHAALFAHQELAFVDSLSRWPVRVMLADEVGLGKTFEAGAVVSYLLRHTEARTALILAPKAVIYQWQAELDEHFGLDAWVYESNRRSFLSSNGEVRVLSPSEPVLGKSAPEIVIMSAQLARGTRRGRNVFAGVVDMPDVLVVDEAHAARVRPDLNGSERPTLMWRLLDEIMPRVPHVIFATATPMQVHWREYHALLELLGLPELWREPDNYHGSLELVTLSGSPTLGDASLAARLIRDAITAYRPSRSRMDDDERQLLTEIVDTEATNDIAAATTVMAHWQAARRLLVKAHPAQLLTVRNTRTALEEIGYKFPSRELPPVALDVPDEVRSFYKHVDRYLSDAYFDLERALFPEKKFSIGFVKCGYQQRLASSLAACQLSLQRRRDRVSAAVADLSNTAALEREMDELLDSDFSDDEAVYEPGSQVSGTADIPAARRAARIELQYLNDLARIVERILGDGPDPKLDKVVELLRHHLDAGDSVLVFSRYTDTLDAVMQAFRIGTEACFEPYALYTGPTSEITHENGSVRATRREVREALDDGVVRVVFCSDAASEGLNLQAARVLINVDVPWNPARLEQRIGRVARLGQKAESVSIYNLWYPDSIEARIYKRLVERADLYELAVGEFPEVVGSAIRSEVTARYGGPQSRTDALAELNRLKNDVQVAALRSLWVRETSGTTLTGKFREDLSTLAISAAEAAGALVTREPSIVRIVQGEKRIAYTTEPGSDRVITLQHPALSWFARLEVSQTGPESSVMCTASRPVFFAMGGQPVDPVGVPAFLAVMSESPASGSLERVALLLEDGGDHLRREWLPRPQDLAIPAHLELPLPAAPDFSISEMSSVDIRAMRETICE